MPRNNLQGMDGVIQPDLPVAVDIADKITCLGQGR
jgi:hypothetical protein